MKAIVSLILLMLALAVTGFCQARRHSLNSDQHYTQDTTSMDVENSFGVNTPMGSVPGGFQQAVRKPFGYFYAIRVRGIIAYRAVGRYLEVLDLSNAASPEVIQRQYCPKKILLNGFKLLADNIL